MKALITGHGDFAKGMKSALELITGPREEISIVPFTENVVLEEFQREIQVFIKSNEEAVIFTDLFGGTPFNTAMLAKSGKQHIHVLGGTNLPMLVEYFSSTLANMEEKEMMDIIQRSGKEGIKEGILELKKMEEYKEGI
jgi:mannose/fructose/sorbose-specific phosphotransferase system IIA component